MQLREKTKPISNIWLTQNDSIHRIKTKIRLSERVVKGFCYRSPFSPSGPQLLSVGAIAFVESSIWLQAANFVLFASRVRPVSATFSHPSRLHVAFFRRSCLHAKGMAQNASPPCGTSLRYACL